MPNTETTFDVPLFFCEGMDLVKAEDGKRLCFKGWATTSRRDHKGEKVFPGGLDFSYLLKKPEDGGGGGFRWKHTPDPKKGEGFDDPKYAQVAILKSLQKGTHPKSGEPGIFVEGEFFDDQTGRDLFQKQLAMQELGRGFGLSVEGAVKARDPRDPNSITKAIVRNIAFDMHPMNPDSRIEAFYKAMGAGDDEDDDRDPGEFEPDSDDIEEEKRRKAEEAEEADANKCLDSTAIQPIAPESLDGSPSVQPRRKRKREKMMKDELKKAFDELSADEKREFLSSCGAAPRDEDDDSLAKAMDDLSDTNERLRVQIESMDTLEKAMGVSIDDLPEGSLARTAADSVDFQRALGERMIAQEPVLAELAKSLGDVVDLVKSFESTMRGLDQAMGRAQAPTGIPSGVAAMPHPADRAASGGETLTKAQAEIHILGALRKARREGNSTAAANLDEALQNLSFAPSHATMLKADLEALECIS